VEAWADPAEEEAVSAARAVEAADLEVPAEAASAAAAAA
jgi:hypothetical protein